MLAGVYPVGMKLMAGWSRSSLRTAMGMLVGALALGSAMPSLFVYFSASDGTYPVTTASLGAAFGGCMINLVWLGPDHSRAQTFKLLDALRELRRPEVSRVTRGYSLPHLGTLRDVGVGSGRSCSGRRLRLMPGVPPASLLSRRLPSSPLDVSPGAGWRIAAESNT
jgi:hypothetical protein